MWLLTNWNLSVVFVNITNPFEAEDDISDDDFLLQHGSHSTEEEPPGGWDDTLSTPEPRDAESGGAPAYTPGMEGVSDFAQHSLDNLRGDSDPEYSRSVTASVRDDIVSKPMALTPPAIQVDDEDLDDNGDDDDPEASIIALKLLRHFRQGPGQW